MAVRDGYGSLLMICGFWRARDTGTEGRKGKESEAGGSESSDYVRK